MTLLRPDKHISYKICGLILVLLVHFSCAPDNKKQSRLAGASSPYLVQHADNPVDWYEWGEEALSIAKKENKPLLISIGYASCHWCHQMEKESFMDTAIARVMNENFICIKVDREQRPDIEKVYMNACELITGNSGWPLNAFALPDGKPFYAGTYYSSQSWLSLLKQMRTAWHAQNKKVLLQAQSLSRGIAQLELSVLSDNDTPVLNQKFYGQLFSNIYPFIDQTNGGWKGSPKFPAPTAIEFLLQYYFVTKDKRSLDAVTTTLKQMALGGIYDQVGGGFARYATDSLWRVPHFEKMLYDNAQLISVYAHAYQVSGDNFFKIIAEETIAFVRRELKHTDGGYFSSVNADSGEGEGAFYTWTAEEISTILPAANQSVLRYYNIKAGGNWKAGKNILYASATPGEYANANNVDFAGFSADLAKIKKALLKVRNGKTQPAIDDKILTSWNALLIKGLLDAYAAFGNETYLHDAIAASRFLDKMIAPDGRLSRSCKNGSWSVAAFLDDYAFLASAWLRLYELTFDKYWLVRSQLLVDYCIKNFFDPASGMFYYTSANADNNLLRKIEITDNETPASNSVMASVLHRLGVYLREDGYLQKTKTMLNRLSQELSGGRTKYYMNWCFLAGQLANGPREVAIVGREALAKSISLQKNYLPLAIYMGSAMGENIPALEGKGSEGNTLIFVCENSVCKRPVSDTALALQQLSNSSSVKNKSTDRE